VEVQKLKFCKEHGLPITITDTPVIKLIRKDVSGGNSFVSHRYNISDEICINRLIHDIDNHRIISTHTGTIMKLVCGADFNSLYPFTHSTINTNKITYADGRLLKTDSMKFYTIDF
jgi:hypothetical protein